MVTEHVSISENSDIESEKYIQKNIQNAKESFQDSDIISKKVLECRYLSSTEIEYNSESHFVSKNSNCKNTRKPKVDSKVYLPVFVLDYNGISQTYSMGYFHKLENAKNELNSIDSNKNFRFIINSNSKIIHNKKESNIYEYIRLSDKLKSFTSIDTFNLVIYPIIFSFITIFYLSAFADITPIEELIMGVGLLFIPLIPAIIQTKIKNAGRNLPSYSALGIDSSMVTNLPKKNNTDTTSKTINASISVDESGITVTSNELNCEWFYRRNNDKSLTYSGVELVQNLPISDNTCVITVKKSGYDYKWLSSNEEWQIDTKLSFN